MKIYNGKPLKLKRITGNENGISVSAALPNPNEYQRRERQVLVLS
jgi:hypothetical protein